MKFTHFLLIIVLVAAFHSSFSQNEGNIWYFGQYAGLDFNNGTPVTLNNSAMDQAAGCATISDAGGNLLFYTNSENIWNKNHTNMLNGSGLMGAQNATQSVIIVPKPGDNLLYYVFTVDDKGGQNGLMYSIVDMRLDGGAGGVTIKNVLLQTPVDEKLLVVKHSDQESIWLITHGFDNNKFYAFRVSSSGIDTSPVVSSIGSALSGNFTNGYLKASQDNSKLAMANLMMDMFEIFDFNNSTGKVSNPITFNNYDDVYGIEFSPASSRLYISLWVSKSICQFDMLAGSTAAIKSSVKTIGTTTNLPCALQLAPDGKIYLATSNSQYLGVINNPDNLDTACNFVENAVYLLGRKCWQGLPPAIQNYFSVSYYEAKNTCLGDSTIFTIAYTANLDSVTWNFDDSLSGSNNYSDSLNPAHIFSSTGSYDIKLIGFNLGESDTFVKTVQIGQYPHAYFYINNTIQCLKGNNFSFLDSSWIKSGIISYAWNFGDGDTSSSVNPVHSYNFDDTFNVKLIVTSDNGCKDSVIKNLVVKGVSANFEINDSLQCFLGNNYAFSNTSINNYGLVSYKWYFGDGDNSVLDSVVHTYTSTGTFRVRLIAYSDQNCTDSVDKIIIVNPTPKAEFSINDSSQCFKGNNFIFTNNSVISSGSMTYTWSLGGGNQANTEHVNYSYNVVDTYSVKLITISDMGCVDSIQRNVFIHPMPNADFNVNDSIQCLKSNKFIFSNNSSIPGSGSPFRLSYMWSFGNGDTSSLDSPVHNYLNDGAYNVILVVTTDQGCIDSITKNINIFPSPGADFLINDSIQCLDNNYFTFTNNSTLSTGTLNYLWIIEDTIYTIQNLSHSFSYTDTFQVKLITTSDLNCTDSMTKNVFVYPMPVTAFIFLNNCLEDTIYFFDSSFVNDPDFIKQWLWNLGDSSYSYQKNAAHIYNDSGNYKVIHSTTTDFGCSDSATKFVKIDGNVTESELLMATVEDDENILIEWTKPKYGNPKMYSLEKSLDGMFFSNLIDLDNQIFSYIDKYVQVDQQSYVYRLLVTDSCDYQSPYSNIGKSILLKIDAGEDHPILLWTEYKEWPNEVDRYEVQINNKSSGNFVAIAAVSDTTFTDIIPKLNKEDYCYRIMAYEKSDTSIYSISNKACLPTPLKIWIPNSFTPNEDGTNDLFQIKGTFIIDYQISIFNRWGERVFLSENIEKSWNGTFEGKECPEENYYYQIVAKGTKGQKESIKGMVLLVK